MDQDDPRSEYIPEHLKAADGPRAEGDYDALADLFLGGGDLAPTPVNAAGAGRGGRPDTPGPTPGARVEAGAMIEAALGATARKPRATPLLKRPYVEAVVLGHLPVRAGLWVRQYASSVAGDEGACTALLRTGADGAVLEIVGPGAVGGTEPTLSDAVQAADRITQRWIVRVDEPGEPDLAEHPAVDAVTVLTGADEAAIVASYRLLKSLASAWDQAFGPDDGPELRVAVMGASPEEGERTAIKLERAAASFLSRPVRVVATVQKIGATASATLYRGELTGDVAHLLDAVKGLESTPAAPAAHLRLAGADDDVDDRPVPDPYELDERALRDEVFGDAAVNEPTAPEPAPEVVVRPPVAVKPRRPEPPEPATDPGVVEAIADAGPAMAGLIPGLAPLESRCPHTASVELAADTDGRLHLLAFARDGVDAEQALQRLVAAAAWARAHFSLLLRCEPELAQPSADRAISSDPVLNLLTDQPAAARDLLDADLRVYLVTRVSLAGHVGCVATALN